jgi:hypothetical protein
MQAASSAGAHKMHVVGVLGALLLLAVAVGCDTQLREAGLLHECRSLRRLLLPTAVPTRPFDRVFHHISRLNSRSCVKLRA